METEFTRKYKDKEPEGMDDLTEPEIQEYEQWSEELDLQFKEIFND